MRAEGIIKKFIAILSLFLLFTWNAGSAYAYAILFQDDSFATVDSNALQLGYNKAGASNTTIKFGASATTANNGIITFDVTAKTFVIDHPVTINKLMSGDALLINDSGPGDTTPFIITDDGDVGIGATDPDNPLNPVKLKIEAEAGQNSTILSAGDINNYLETNVHNRNSGDTASSDVVATNDTGDESTNYIDVGINSSGYNNTDYSIVGPNDAYLYNNGGKLTIGTQTIAQPLIFHTGGTLAANERMRIDGDGNVGIGTTNPGALLDVKGEFRLSGATSGYVGFAPAAAAGSTIYTLPAADGSNGYALVTNGLGTLSWQSVVPPWKRTGTLISPVTDGDNVTTSGNIYTTGSGTITSAAAMTAAGLLTGNAGLSITGGAVNLNASSNNNTNINTGTSTGAVAIGNGAAGTISATSGTSVTLKTGSTTVTTDATNITLQPAGSGATGNVQIGAGGAGSANPDVLTLDVKSTAGDPAGAEGAIYYNEFANKFRCHVNGSWADCDTTGGTVTLQSAYNSGPDIATAVATPIHFDLASGNFNVDGTGAVNLTPNAASQFTSGGALTLTGGADSFWGTTTGDLILYANGSATGGVHVGADDTPSATPDFLSLDLKSAASGTGDPTGGDNGDMYYNEARDAMRCFVAGSWQNCGQTAASATTLQQAYTAGNAISTSGSNIAFTLNTTDQFTTSGAGSVNLTPTGASSFTSGGALTFTGGAASTWGTTAGNLNLQVAGSGTTANVQIGSGSASATPDRFVLDQGTADPAGTAGAMYYNTVSSRFRCYEAGAWVVCGANAPSSTSLQNAYDNGAAITAIAAKPVAVSTITGDGDFNITGTGATTLNPTGGVNLGSATSAVNLPGLTASAPVFTDASKNLTSTGTVPIAQGGTGQTAKGAAFDALSPQTTKGDLVVRNGSGNVRLPVGGTNGLVLMVDSTQATGVKWAAGSGTGTVTSVDVSGDATGLTFTGGPVTTSGTITLGGTLNLASGGTNNGLTASNGGIVFSDASKLNILSGTATSGKMLQSGSSASPSWSTPTYPSGSGSSGAILRSNGTNNVYSTATYPDTAGTAGNILRSDGTNFVSTAVTTAQATPANPTGTTNTTGVMMGLAESITPVRSGKILITISGNMTNGTTTDGAQVQIRTGTGTAPANGAALTGTAQGGLVRMLNPSDTRGGTITVPFSTNAIVSGLVAGTAVWIDAALAAITGGTASIANVSVSVVEL